jgi:hypothetical protein
MKLDFLIFNLVARNSELRDEKAHTSKYSETSSLVFRFV